MAFGRGRLDIDCSEYFLVGSGYPVFVVWGWASWNMNLCM